MPARLGKSLAPIPKELGEELGCMEAIGAALGGLDFWNKDGVINLQSFWVGNGSADENFVNERGTPHATDLTNSS